MDDDDLDAAPAVNFDPFGLVIIGLRLVYDVHSSFTFALESLHDRAASHANWRRARKDWASVAGAEIEAMTSGER